MKVGDYVRTNKGYIAKIKKITELTIMCDGIIYPTKNYGFDKQLNKESLKRLQVKSSPNIIDLIEVGDYVNGEKVCYLKGQVSESDINSTKDVLYTEYVNEYGEWYGYEEDEIKSIVTKEQFESMEYKVGE